MEQVSCYMKIDTELIFEDTLDKKLMEQRSRIYTVIK